MNVNATLNGEDVVIVSMEEQRLTALIAYIDAQGGPGNLKLTEVPLTDLPLELATGSDVFTAVERTGDITVFNDLSVSGSHAITVPAGANICVVGAAYYEEIPGFTFTSLNFVSSGVEFTEIRSDSGLQLGMTNLFYLVNPPTGEQTLHWEWPTAIDPGNEGAIIYTSFYKNVNTDDPIVTHDGEEIDDASIAQATLVGLSAGDMAIGVNYAYSRDDPIPIDWTGLIEQKSTFFNQITCEWAQQRAISSTVEVEVNCNELCETYITLSAAALRSSSTPIWTFNPLNTSILLTLSNGNLTIERGGGSNNAVSYSIGSVSSGKWYCELYTADELDTNAFTFGVVEPEYSLEPDSWPGQTALSYGLYGHDGETYNDGNNFVYGPRVEIGDIVMMAIDMDNGKIYWGVNGTWYDTGDPENQTNPAFTGLSGEKHIACSLLSNPGSAVTINFGATDFTYTPPVGFEGPGE